MGSDGVLIDRRRSGGFRWSFDRRGFCGDQVLIAWVSFRWGFDRVGSDVLWGSGFERRGLRSDGVLIAWVSK